MSAFGHAVERSTIRGARRAPTGRFARILAAVLELKPTQAYAVPILKRADANHVARQVMKIARKEGLRISWDRSADDKLVFLWVERGGAA